MQMLDLMLYSAVGVLAATFLGICALLGWAIYTATESYDQAEREKQS